VQFLVCILEREDGWYSLLPFLFPFFWLEYEVPAGILDHEVNLRMEDFHNEATEGT